MKITCPECQSQFPISAGFFDADGKRLGMALAGAEPALGRAIVQYLALHKPEKTVLRLAKAAKLAEEVIALAAAGEVGRGGIRRHAAASLWTQAIEHMLDNRAKLRLPLSGHGYLIEVVFGLADQEDAQGERKREADARAGRHLDALPKAAQPPSETPLERELSYIHQQVRLGGMTPEAAGEARIQARTKYGSTP